MPGKTLKIIDEKDRDELIAEALRNGDTLATVKESQMLINMTGVSINEKPRKDGRYQGYVLRNGVKQYVYGKTREDIAVKIKKILSGGEIPVRKKREKKSITLSAWLDRWLELYKKPNLKPLSVRNIQRYLSRAYRELGDKKITEITTDDLQAFLLRFDSLTMRDSCKIYLTEAFRKANLQGFIKINPCLALEIKKSKSGKRQALTTEQQNIFVEAIRDNAYEALFLFLLGTGLRIGEALALTWEDIDVEHKSVAVTKNVIFIEGKKVVQQNPKTAAGIRKIPIANLAWNALPETKTQGEIFPFNSSTVQDAFQRISSKVGFPVTAHILRHTYATRLEEAGISPKLKQYLMGHATIQMTQNVYTDIQENYLLQNSSSIQGIFDTK